jgi:membrane protease YdiL (CAAX protease family)
MKDGTLGVLVGGALLALFLVYAALHDISRAGESDYTAEYIGLAIGAVGLAYIHRQALRMLAPKRRRIWLWVMIGVMALFDLAALSASLNPKYPNDRAVGTAFLAVTLPLLGLACIQAICPCCQRRSSCRS